MGAVGQQAVDGIAGGKDAFAPRLHVGGGVGIAALHIVLVGGVQGQVAVSQLQGKAGRSIR